MRSGVAVASRRRRCYSPDQPARFLCDLETARSMVTMHSEATSMAVETYMRKSAMATSVWYHSCSRMKRKELTRGRRVARGRRGPARLVKLAGVCERGVSRRRTDEADREGSRQEVRLRGRSGARPRGARRRQQKAHQHLTRYPPPLRVGGS